MGATLSSCGLMSSAGAAGGDCGTVMALLSALLSLAEAAQAQRTRQR
jgi:hypothetical protein